MTKNYKYRPHFFYIPLGLAGLYLSYIFLRTIRVSEFGKNLFQVLVGFFGLMWLVFGIICFKKFINNFSFSDLKLGDDFIVIPGRWNTTVTISFSDIDKVENSPDKIIAISSKSGLYAIDGARLSVEDFRELKDLLTKINVR